MEKYTRKELRAKLNNCDVQEICQEVYNEMDKENRTPMSIDDSNIIDALSIKQDKMKLSNINSSIIMVSNTIPCLVVHNSNLPVTKSVKSIREIYFPFKGDKETTIYFIIQDVRSILDMFSEDDFDITHIMYRKLY